MKLEFVRLEWIRNDTQKWLDRPLKEGMAINRGTGNYIRSTNGKYLLREPNKLVAVFISEAPYNEIYKKDITDMVHDMFKNRKNISTHVREIIEEEFIKEDYQLVSIKTRMPISVMSREEVKALGKDIYIDGLRITLEKAIRKIDP